MDDPIKPGSRKVRKGRQADESHARDTSGDGRLLGGLLPEGDGYLGMDAVVAYTKASDSTIRAWIKEGLPAYRKGRGSRSPLIFRRSEVDAWIQRYRVRDLKGNLKAELEALARSFRPPLTGK